MQYLLYILSIPFLYLNYKIIKNDVKEKKIPNKYLGYLLLLLPFYYILYFYFFDSINLYIYLFQFILVFLVSFLLYYFGVWAAGDAKYLLILSLYLPGLGIIPIIGNISLVTIVYLIGYFVWFYLIKIPFNKVFRNDFKSNIKQDLTEKWQNYKKNKGGNSIYIIIKYITIFLTIFVSFRLFRMYLFNDIISQNSSMFGNLSEIFGKYNFYLIFLIIGLTILFVIIIKKSYKYLVSKINEVFLVNIENVENIIIGFLLLILILFTIKEFIVNPSEISHSLYLIFTVYIVIHIFVKILMYSYKVTFGISESEYVNIDDLKVGDLIDKVALIKLFGGQAALIEDKSGIYDLGSDEYFLNFKNPVDIESLEVLKKSFELVNDYHKREKTLGFVENKKIKILKTFAFGPYIFAGFLITFVFGNLIINFLVENILDIIKGMFF
ncbi:MAG: hypothetical protein PHS49_00200 [Candidatus Gracilibacteria bacterium]|nr:hypothetical protein [Candidatus Gracilibacteria bacterium]